MTIFHCDIHAGTSRYNPSDHLYSHAKLIEVNFEKKSEGNHSQNFIGLNHDLRTSCQFSLVIETLKDFLNHKNKCEYISRIIS